MKCTPFPRIARCLSLLAVTTGVLLLVAAPARAQFSERIVDYDVDITIGEDGTLTIVEAIDYDFGVTPRHGILRDIPTRLRYDDTYDRIYPLDVVEVRRERRDPGRLRGRVGGGRHHPDQDRRCRHRDHRPARVRARLHGRGRAERLRVTTTSSTGTRSARSGRRRSSGRPCACMRPADITQVACFQGYEGSTLPCAALDVRRCAGAVRAERAGLRTSGVTIVVGLPKGAVPEPAPVLEERWSFGRAFAATPATLGGTAVVGLAAIGGRRRARLESWTRPAVPRFTGRPGDGQPDGRAPGRAAGRGATTGARGVRAARRHASRADGHAPRRAGEHARRVGHDRRPGRPRATC